MSRLGNFARAAGVLAVVSATVLTQLPSLPVTAVLLVSLARIVLKHDRVATRDRVLTEAGSRLAAAGDRRGVHTAALDAVSRLSAETPAAGVSVAAGGGWRAGRSAGPGWRTSRRDGPGRCR